MSALKDVFIYQSGGREPFTRWYDRLRDERASIKIDSRITRAQSGNLGDHRTVGAGVVELRIDYGPGYRLYIGLEGDTLLVLLLGGDKSTQNADIRLAQSYWQEYRRSK